MNTTGIIILAAGASTRLGEPKQNLLFRGKTLLNHAIDVAIPSDCKPIIAVTGAATSVIDKGSKTKIHEVNNPDWHKGIASSISLGVSYLQEKAPDINEVIIMVCDQPYVTSILLNQLRSEKHTSGKRIIASSYQDTLGTPVLFDKFYFNMLSSLKGEEGAKRIIYQNLADVSSIRFSEGYIDVDTKEDYKNLLT
ncbi:MAG: MobA-like protein [Cytophagales bacterium CG18_big_fil_WC_8_21_14_2_50_42_9]|nr:MAG: MobA-like protein [Cytophagales bacterium CG18_big_fil_WC_8_21_14_2_50_42_9]